MLTPAHVNSYGSGFTAQLSGARCNWDLNGLIHHPENVLRAVDSCVPGVTQYADFCEGITCRASRLIYAHAYRPWLYYGTLFATFCWHKEDHNLYSVNYLHTGESKTWYGVPPSASKTFEKALRQSVPRLFEEVRQPRCITLDPLYAEMWNCEIRRTRTSCTHLRQCYRLVLV